jgi:hypothetical protein
MLQEILEPAFKYLVEAKQTNLGGRLYPRKETAHKVPAHTYALYGGSLVTKSIVQKNLLEELWKFVGTWLFDTLARILKLRNSQKRPSLNHNRNLP